MDSTEDKSYKNQALIGSIIFHAGLLALFFFFVLNTPDPPLNMGGTGIELNYGTVEEGSGEIQTMNQANDSPVAEETAPSPETPEEAIPEPQTEVTPTPVKEEEPLQKSEDEEAPVIEEKKEEKKEVKKVEAPIKIQKTEVKEAPKKEVKVTTENPPKVVSNGKIGTEEKIGGNNNGDRDGKIGDQGNPEGNVNAKALYGNLGEGGEGSGGAGGNKLDLTGWKLAFKLEKKDVTNENGKIVYQIKVDDKGDLVSIIPIEKTVSPAVEKFYRQQIEDNWAVDRSKDNTNPPPIATGKYTVFVRSK